MYNLPGVLYKCKSYYFPNYFLVINIIIHYAVIASFSAVNTHIDMMCIGIILRLRDKSENRVCMI